MVLKWEKLGFSLVNHTQLNSSYPFDPFWESTEAEEIGFSTAPPSYTVSTDIFKVTGLACITKCQDSPIRKEQQIDSSRWNWLRI